VSGGAFCRAIADRHGGVDIVFSNHYARVQPGENPAEVIDGYVAANNLGTTHILRNFAPLIRDNGRLLVVASRAGSLRALAPALHGRFENLQTLDDVDRAVCACGILSVRDLRPDRPGRSGSISPRRSVSSRRSRAGTAATGEDLRRGILIAAISPGLIDTGASRQWLDMTGAPPPDEVAIRCWILRWAAPDAAFYGGLINLGRGEPGGPDTRALDMKQPKKTGADERSLGKILKRAEQAMLKSKTAVLKPVGLTLAQYVALAELEQKQGITPLPWRACFVSPQAIMILLKTMEQQGLVARSRTQGTECARTPHYRCRPRGAARRRAQVAPVEDRIFAAFSRQELEPFALSFPALSVRSIGIKTNQPWRNEDATPGCRWLAATRTLEHDPEKWVPVFRKDHPQTKRLERMTIRRKVIPL